MWETASVSADLRLVYQCSLSGKAAGVEDVVMVLQPRIAVQVGMDEGKVIGFAVILDCELPVAVKREADRELSSPVWTSGFSNSFQRSISSPAAVSNAGASPPIFTKMTSRQTCARTLISGRSQWLTLS